MLEDADADAAIASSGETTPVPGDRPEPAQDPLFDLTGAIAVVTGGARGIGRAAARALARHGASLVLFDRLGEQLEHTARELAEEGTAVELVVGDVRSDADRGQLVDAAASLGPVDIVVNSAGVIRRMDIQDMTVEDLDWMWAVNVRGLVAVNQAFLPQMIERRSGKIINLGSLGSVTGLELRTAYATTKGAVAQYTVSMAAEVGRYGICVNAVAPGYVDTDMAGKWINADPGRAAQLLARIPLGRFATPEDLEGTFAFLASPASDYVTGQVFLVDGGWTAT
jgi:NAD(P)-dependent dehydrogenase (short-subunit alcohol dehydrogenase family)